MTSKIFSEERIQKLMKCIFRPPPHSDYKWDYDQILYRLKIIKILIDSVGQEFVAILDPTYESMISRDFRNARYTAHSILKIVERQIRPVKISD